MIIEKNQAVVAVVVNGMRQSEAARQFGLSRQRVWQLVKASGVSLPERPKKPAPEPRLTRWGHADFASQNMEIVRRWALGERYNDIACALGIKHRAVEKAVSGYRHLAGELGPVLRPTHGRFQNNPLNRRGRKTQDVAAGQTAP